LPDSVLLKNLTKPDIQEKTFGSFGTFKKKQEKKTIPAG